MRTLVLVAMVGCTTGMPAPRTSEDAPVASRVVAAPPATHVIPRETFEFVAKLRGIQVARVLTAVGDAGLIGDRRAIIIKSRGFSDGVLSLVTELTWELTTTLDLGHGHPLEALEEAWLVFRGKKDHERDARSWPGDTEHDVHSLVCAIRGWSAKQGVTERRVLAVGGTEIDLEVWQAGRGEVIGKFPAVRFEGIARERYRFSAWISDDADRVPLMVKAETKWGEITIELVEYGTSAKPIAAN
jgi:hypothetical protein